MLRFVLGRNASGKTEYVREMLAEKLQNGDEGLILLVPEQFSYETEREMLKKVEAKHMLRLEILTFSRLAETVLAREQPTAKQKINDGMRMVLMSMALEALGDKKQIFKSYTNRAGLLKKLVTFSTELKQCAVSPDALFHAGDKLESGALKQKLYELSQITDMYNAFVHTRFSDDTDLLTQLAVQIPQTNWFDGKTVVLDTFAGFTKQERCVIEALLRPCKDVYVTLCTEEKAKTAQNACVFDNILEEMEKLKQAAAKQNVAVAKPIVLSGVQTKKSEALMYLEQNLYNYQKTPFLKPQESIALFAAANRAKECDFVARSIRRLLRKEGMRAREIAVLQRRENTYNHELSAAFQKYEIPYFEDKRQPVAAQPLMVLTQSLLKMAAEGITTETLMRFLKTELTSLGAEETALLENYATVWGIERAKWRTDFTANPDGLGVAMQTQSEKKLHTLNELRRRAVAPVLAFRRDFSEATGTEKAKLLYTFLIQAKVDTDLRAFAKGLQSSGYSVLAKQQDEVWEVLMQILDALALAIGDTVVSSARFDELFEILLESADLGQLPQGLDTVCVSTADRIRTGALRAVFVLGANDGVFPETPPTDGVLNDADRKALLPLGIALTETAEYKTVDERFIAYYALTLAHERLFVSWSVSDYKGGSMAPSDIPVQLLSMFPKCPVLDSGTVPPQDWIESAASAFEVLASVYSANTELSESLKAYMKQLPAYAARTEAIARAASRAEISFSKPEVATELFGKNMMVSASRTETYYKCPFSYFCKYGLKIKSIKKADLDVAQSGTVMHYCLEMILSQNDRDTLLHMTDEQLQTEIQKVIAQYTEEKMGSVGDQEVRFNYLLRNLADAVLDVLKRLVAEFSVSEFIPVAFELSIAPDGEIAPYQLPLADGGSLRVVGSVDRVDVMQKDGKSYLRVIDYKSGGKNFDLSEVFAGLNMQMLIYLYAICENGEGKFEQAVPAGVLYLPAKSVEDKLPRGADPADIQNAKLLNSRMNGVVLHNTDVILGMDSTASGLFIPVSVRGESYTGRLLRPEEFTALKSKVDEKLCDMGLLLHNGKIPVLPAVEGSKNIACTYCDYASICGFEPGATTRQIENYGRFDTVKLQLQKEAEQ